MFLHIDREKKISLKQQLLDQLKRSILEGTLQSGEALPSTRALASELGISRNVVIGVYEQLCAEGYLESRIGSGYYVPHLLYTEEVQKHFSRDPVPLSPLLPSATSNAIDFRYGVPALDLFPVRLWSKLTVDVWRQNSGLPLGLGYGGPEGAAELRTALARYLLRARGVQCEPEQILITSGATQAFFLLTQLLLDQKSAVICEDPITKEIQVIFTSRGASLQPVSVDAHGLDPHSIPTCCTPRLIFLTPSHQFPLGSTLSMQRRLEILHYAKERQSFIVEDDYDSEFRYHLSPIPSMQQLSPDIVIYVGTFSKTIFPSLRIGYIILPFSLLSQFKEVKHNIDLHTPTMDQLVVAHFIEKGLYERHIRSMKKVYQQRRTWLVQMLTETFAHRVKIIGENAGLHLVADFHHPTADISALLRQAQTSVRLYPVEEHAVVKGKHTNQVIFGYGNVHQEHITEGIHRLHTIFGRKHDSFRG